MRKNSKNGRGRTLGAVMMVGAAAVIPRPSYAVPSAWSVNVGKILPSDETVWCVYEPTSLVPAVVNVRLQKRASDGSIITDRYTDPSNTQLAAEMQCFDQQGTSSQMVTSWTGSSIAFADTATLRCPAGKPYGSYIRCKVDSRDGSPFVYGNGNAIPGNGNLPGGDPCSNGISTISASGSASYKGQLTGYVPDLTFQGGKPMYNSTLMRRADVYGTDLGFMFYAHGMLWSGYGDTWANPEKTATPSSGTRGNVLFQTFDLDASNGLGFVSYVGDPSYAREVIRSCHSPADGCKETTAIPSAGFGIKENGKSYTILWFNSIREWNLAEGTITSNGSGLAWSEGTQGGIFTRPNEGAPPPPATPGHQPVWDETSQFGAGAIYQDRLNGYVYFFGQTVVTGGNPIRVARVKANLASIFDIRKYEYWDGHFWQIPPVDDPLKYSKLNAMNSDANLIPWTYDVGIEFSVIFDVAVNKFLMLLMSNRHNPGSNNVQVWESPSITGPWQLRSTDYGTLPHGHMSNNAYWYFYGPYSNEQILGNDGRRIYYQLSEFNVLNLLGNFEPYNVGLWSFDVTPNNVSRCTR